VEEHRRLKQYELISRLGKGGMGEVYRARDTRLGRDVALKILPEELGRDPDRGRRFEREARIASSLSHPGIATLYDFDREGEVAFLTMELVEGASLRQLLEQGPLPMDRVLQCGAEVAEALAAAHRKGIIHRDLKPENVMAADSGYFKVLDFGVARVEDPDRGEPDERGPTRTPTRTWATGAGALVGTVAYMSPEQAMGQKVDARSDIFSFGILLHELCTGQPPFRGPNDVATAQAILHDDPEPARTSRPEVPAGLEMVIRRCLSKRQADRYASATELAEDLQALRMDSLSGQRSAIRLHAMEVLRGGRRRALTVGLVGFGLSVAAVAVWLSVRNPAAPPPTPADPATTTAALPAVATDRPRVVVGFFENLTGNPDADWLGRGLPEMLTTDLSQSSGIEVIATQRLYDLLAAAGNERPRELDRSTVTELARWAGADLVISGSIFRVGGRYRLDAQAYDTHTGAIVAAQKVEGGELLGLVDQLTRGLRSSLRLRAPGAEGLKGLTTTSEGAYRLYVQGREMYDRLDFEQAAAQFERAAGIDPLFARARLGAAMSRYLAGEHRAALAELTGVAASVDRLPEPERLLTIGLHAWLGGGDADTGQRNFQQLVEQFPRNKDARVWWAIALRDAAKDPLEATRKLRQALDQDPNNLPAIAALAGELASLGAEADAEVLLRQTMQHNPEARPALERLIERLRSF